MKKSVAAYAKVLVAVALSSQMALPALADASVRLGGTPVITGLAPSGGLSPDQRARTMQKNMDNALVAATNKGPSSVAVTYVNGQPIVTLGGFYVCSVDAASAKRSGLTASALANKWAANMKTALRNPTSVHAYIAQLEGSSKAPQAGTTTTQAGSYPYYRQGQVVYIPAGMTLPVSLGASLSSQNARTGDRIEAKLAQDVNLGSAVIPAGSLLEGRITDAKAGERMGKSGTLGFKFDKLLMPNGSETPISAHIIGGLEKYSEVGPQSGVYQGEGTTKKVEQAALRGAIGAGAGALAGTTIGAISSWHGYGTGRGAVAGTVIGGALGVADSLLLRKGSDVNMQSGQTLKLQLDAPASVALSSSGM
ncbi:MAG TPA: hypothetical protein V6C81_26130 [Planktothrix sp.]|jgi:hypothetical protein